MPHTLFWNDTTVTFRPGETIAAALMRHGVADLGDAVGGLRARYFCGIGTCQACLVSVNGAAPVESCLTQARDGMQLSPAWVLPQTLPTDAATTTHPAPDEATAPEAPGASA